MTENKAKPKKKQSGRQQMKSVVSNGEDRNSRGTETYIAGINKDSKLADWDDDDYPQQTHGRWAKVVILRHIFTLQELEEDPAARIELKEDVREECEKIGEVTNVVLFAGEEDGVMSVRFANEEDALKCVTVCSSPFSRPGINVGRK